MNEGSAQTWSAMDLLIDNTAAHSALRCLEGAAIGEVDIEGLFQLARALVFADRIRVSGFEVPEIRERTQHLVDRLRNFGFDAHVVDIATPPAFMYRAACETAANEFADTLLLMDWKKEPDVSAVVPGQLSAAAVTYDPRRTYSFSDVIARPEKAMELLEEVFNREGVDITGRAIAYMLWKSDTLLDSLHKLFKGAPDAAEDAGAMLNTGLRVYLNTELADQIDASYMPAVGRARMFAVPSSVLLDRAMHLVDDVAVRLRPDSLHLPIIDNYLVARGRGDPEGILRIAADVRQRASGLREWLREMGSSGDEHVTARSFEELVKTFESDLSDSGPKLRDIWTSVRIFGIPILPWVKFVPLHDWCHFVARRKKIAILTDLCRVAGFRGFDKRAHQRLRAKAMRSAEGHVG